MVAELQTKASPAVVLETMRDTLDEDRVDFRDFVRLCRRMRAHPALSELFEKHGAYYAQVITRAPVLIACAAKAKFMLNRDMMSAESLQECFRVEQGQQLDTAAAQAAIARVRLCVCSFILASRLSVLYGHRAY